MKMNSLRGLLLCALVFGMLAVTGVRLYLQFFPPLDAGLAKQALLKGLPSGWVRESDLIKHVDTEVIEIGRWRCNLSVGTFENTAMVSFHDVGFPARTLKGDFK